MKKSRQSNRQSRQSHHNIKPDCSARSLAYYGYVSDSTSDISARGVEDSLLANTDTPRISVYGLEANTLLDGWWYTGIDEEMFDQIIDTCIGPSFN